jgi:tetratricopeptide (TPR) repeat protein
VAAGAALAGVVWRYWLLRAHFQEGGRWLAAIRGRAERLPVSLTAELSLGTGVIAFHQCDFALAREASGEALDLGRSSGDQRIEAAATSMLGSVAQRIGDLDRALQLFDRARALYEALGDSYRLARAYNDMAVVEMYRGRLDAAADYLTRTSSLAEALGDRSLRGLAMSNLGFIALERGDLDTAESSLREALSTALDSGAIFNCITFLEGLAAVAGARRDPLRAARLFGAAEAARETAGMPLPEGDRAEYDDTVRAGRIQTDSATFDAAWSAGRQLDLVAAARGVLDHESGTATAL